MSLSEFQEYVGGGRTLIVIYQTMTRHIYAILSIALLLFVTIIVAARRAPTYVQNDWLEPFPAFRIAGNLYYVGSKGLAAYLVTTPEGHILINSNMEANVPMIRASMESLGFKFNDIKILLISHAHSDHCGGSATIKRLTGAKYMVMEGDVDVVESGGKTDFHYGNDPEAVFAPTKVDRVLRDGDDVKLGGATLTARLTPGHTKGCTTWTMKVDDGSKQRDVVIVGSPNVNPGYNLVGGAVYPRMAEDFEKTFRVLKSLPVDYFLGAHGSYFDLEGKFAQSKSAAATPFIDPAGYKSYVADREEGFLKELKKQKSAVTPSAAQIDEIR
ncbi:MAG: subclass B3 metallo-beta-lactamase [Acidobacteria bacterium]|nr:subclass B3 metallo-beta-lactamase [Acidobacteriota bacterium]